ncbi:uncharacterized protein V1510DRAFT_402730 [Dipodascopsis tothii]|uniref:uncharacterized protein n=1 Tax=Dipodascopsis tothii TaxID=44089 RepID=UPI0034CDD57A
MAKQLLLTGASGYIGGDVLVALGRLAAAGAVALTLFVRDADAVAARVRADLGLPAAVVPAGTPVDGIAVVAGTYEDRAVFGAAIRAADIVVHTGDAADSAAAAAVLAAELAGWPAGRDLLLIHTSGTAILVDPAENDRASSRVWDDVADIRAITAWPAGRPHGTIDQTILGIHRTAPGGVRTLVVAPPLVYGRGRGPGNQRSQQVPTLIGAVAALGRNAIVGSGRAIWGNVHVQDLSALYALLVRTYLEAPHRLAYNADGYYFASAGEHAWRSLTVALDAPLVRHGVVAADRTSADGTAVFSAADYRALLDRGTAVLPSFFVTNSRSRATRARALGWAPTRESLAATLDDEVRRFVGA